MDARIVDELMEVLSPYPGGLRRWSVMRAIRNHRSRTARSVSHKFEDQIERVFRNFCANRPDAKPMEGVAGSALFYRPEGKAGEVWAVLPNRVQAWRDGTLPEMDEAFQRMDSHNDN